MEEERREREMERRNGEEKEIRMAKIKNNASVKGWAGYKEIEPLMLYWWNYKVLGSRYKPLWETTWQFLIKPGM